MEINTKREIKLATTPFGIKVRLGYRITSILSWKTSTIDIL